MTFIDGERRGAEPVTDPGDDLVDGAGDESAHARSEELGVLGAVGSIRICLGVDGSRGIRERQANRVQQNIHGAEMRECDLVWLTRLRGGVESSSDTDGASPPAGRDADTSPGESWTLQVPPVGANGNGRDIREVNRSTWNVRKPPRHPCALMNGDPGISKRDGEKAAMAVVGVCGDERM